MVTYGKYSVDFEIMKAFDHEWLRWWDLMVLDDALYIGKRSQEEECGMRNPRPGSWSYFGTGKEEAKRMYNEYVNWQLEKALNLDFADEA